jgi:hypothetical protein
LRLWHEIRVEDFSPPVRKQQLHGILNWCIENIDEMDETICTFVEEATTTDTEQISTELSWIFAKSSLSGTGTQDKTLVKMKPWDLAQYLAIYDYIYISRLFSESSLEELLAPIAPDDATIFSNPDLRGKQV